MEHQVVAPAKVVKRAEILRKKAENNTTELNSTLNK
jgi:hypothetical protein